MARCFLRGGEGAGLNLGLAAAAWNIKKWINEFIFLPSYYGSNQKTLN
ncbi:Unannotated [Lentimonas sp. CC4]|nr:Unannotated [Lentimonas sp. CC4]CAA6687499.1 Unannotated [Lentimonas sp. CC6]CAA7075437.1 Unannotated [Lentimonas sp. CC4]CAA7172157.1 Unannotated [Lentimonas sp. CC21]CAA7183533.1 Unannotated [Lentimonas sp. CC8]